MQTEQIKQNALQLLREGTQSEEARFRGDQWPAIECMLHNERLLLVQRTGWGKSIVYFIATKLLRERGAGPTLLVSPLLSLMRNQLDAARRMGIRAYAWNSETSNEWESIEENIQVDEVDILLISPERFANENFRKMLTGLRQHIGLFVVDEAHCISDWGHDFRPDYKRIARMLSLFPPDMPVLATTATANARVVEDVQQQIGEAAQALRGPLTRNSLHLQSIALPNPAARMAWLAEQLPTIPGSGIIYVLTKRDAKHLSGWLNSRGIPTQAYASESTDREGLETALLNNELKALVATVALGMGFDKPDLGFVIHFQRPASVVHYYQQVGRAGRNIREARGVLLGGNEDDEIADYFIRSAFPPQQHIDRVIGALDRSEKGLTKSQLLEHVNLPNSQVEKCLKYMLAESPAPVVKAGSAYRLTAKAGGYRVDQELVEQITQLRRKEQQQMQAYMNHSGCLMQFLTGALDDPNAQACGKCQHCAPDQALPTAYSRELAQEAIDFLKKHAHILHPRKQWPEKDLFEHLSFPHNSRNRIPPELRAEEGRALCLWGDAGWGELVKHGKYEAGEFSDELVEACVALLRQWNPHPAPVWATCIPSNRRPKLVPGFAERLAAALGIPFSACIAKTARDNQPQKTMENSYQQAKNLDGVFEVDEALMNEGPCLLVDDMVDSRWTLTIAAAQLRQAGCEAVFPLALALNSLS